MRLTKVEVLRESIKIIIGALSEKSVPITQVGSRAFVEWHPTTGRPKRINIPYVPDNASDRLIKAVQGFVDHECAHVLFTDFECVKLAIKSGAGMVGNILEDTYIERKMKALYAGSRHNLLEVWGFLAEEMLKEPLDAAIEEGHRAKIVATGLPIAIHAWAGNEAAEDFMATRWDAFKDIKKIIGDDIIDKIPEVKSSHDGLLLAVAMKNRLLEWKEKEEREEQEKREKERSEKEKEESGGDPDPDGDTDPDGDSSDPGMDDVLDDPEPGEGDSSMDDDDDAEESEGDDDCPEGDEEEEGDEGDESGGGGDEEEEESDFDEDDEDFRPAAPRSDEDKEPEEESEVDGDSGKDEDDSKEEGEEGETEFESTYNPDDDEEGKDESGTPVGDDDDKEGDPDDKPTEEESEKSDEEGGGTTTPEGPPPESEEKEEEEIDMSDFESEAEEMLKAMEDMEDMEGVSNELIAEEMDKALSSTDYWPLTKDCDVIERYTPKRIDRNYVRSRQDEISKHIGQLTKRLQRMIQAKSYDRRIPGFRSGKLDGAALHRVPTGDDRVFRRTHKMTTKDVDVQLVVDLSGSMGGPKVELATEVAYAVGLPLDRLGINNQIVGFTTKGMTGISHHTKILEEKHEGRDPSRYEPIYMPILKDWNQNFTPDRQTAVIMSAKDVDLWNNIDGESIEYAGKMLWQQPGNRKLMIVLSDGCPSAHGSRKEQSVHLRRVIRRLEAAGTEVFGIGIMDDSVKRFYKNAVVIEHLDEVLSTVMGLLENMLMRGAL